MILNGTSSPFQMVVQQQENSGGRTSTGGGGEATASADAKRGSSPTKDDENAKLR